MPEKQAGREKDGEAFGGTKIPTRSGGSPENGLRTGLAGQNGPALRKKTGIRTEIPEKHHLMIDKTGVISYDGIISRPQAPATEEEEHRPGHGKYSKKEGVYMYLRKWLCGVVASAMVFSVGASALAAAPMQTSPNAFPHHYTGGEVELTKISHPEHPANTRYAAQKWADGLLDYVGEGRLGVPGVDEGANGQGDRGQSYSWGSIASGDWLYVSTLYSAMLSTMQLAPAAGHQYDPETLEKMAEVLYQGDFFVGEEDDGNPRSALSKINVKTGEVKLLMGKEFNGISGQFRNAVEYHGKLYFCGSPNGLPSIWEIDPETDEFRRAYVDPEVAKDPGVILQAIKEKRLSIAIRGMTVFNDYLVISCVGPDANPYIAVSNNIDEGFTKIASTWKEGTDNTVEGELLGYPACHLNDSIYGGHIWEIMPFDGKLYVSICTGTPQNSPDGGKSMQSFALMRGECPSGDYENRDAWTWTPVVGDKADGAAYTFGIDPERTRAGACTMQVFGDHLYIGEYNDAEIAMLNMVSDKDFQFMADNLEQSVSLYRMDADEHMELVMGDPTDLFPESLSGLHSGFGKNGTVHENQYIWRMEVFQGKLYAGTFDQSSLLDPLARFASGDIVGMTGAEWNEQLNLMKQRAAVTAGSQQLTAVQNEMEQLRAEGGCDILSLPAVLNDGQMDTLQELHQAMCLLPELLDEKEDWTLEQRIQAKANFLNLYRQMLTCYQNLDEVPSYLRQSYDLVLNGPSLEDLIQLNRCLSYLKNAQQGFDMFVSEDGVNFETISRNGLGDPYNQGLRALSYNSDAENPWLAVGTANPFYGTQIWRLEGEGLNVGQRHSITAETSANGRILTAQEAAAGSTVTVQTQAEEGYQVLNLKARTAQGQNLQLQRTDSGYSFVMPDSPVELTAFFTAFRDLREQAYYMDSVEWASENAIASGVAPDRFAPGGDCTRAQAVTFLWRAAGCPAPGTAVNPFTDVKETDYFYQAVLWATQQGITQGVSPDTFNPGASCRRAQIVTFLWRAAGAPAQQPGSAFVDVPRDSYYAQAVQWAVDNGVTQGSTEETFSPEAKCVRGQIVTFLYRYELTK